MKKTNTVEKSIKVGQDVYHLTLTDTTLNAVRLGGACKVSMPVNDGDVKAAIKAMQERLGFHK